jgi:hypothetical protein
MNEVFISLVLTMCACVVGIFIGINTTNTKFQGLQKEAVQLNFAEYNSTNGVWQWKTNSVNIK